MPSIPIPLKLYHVTVTSPSGNKSEVHVCQFCLHELIKKNPLEKYHGHRGVTFNQPCDECGKTSIEYTVERQSTWQKKRNRR